MSGSTTKNVGKKTNTLGINKIPEGATILTIAKACEKFSSMIKGVRLVKFKSDNVRNALIEFITPKQCESAMEDGEIKIDGLAYPLHYARSSNYVNFNVSASEDKLYIKYPEGAREDEIIRMLGDVAISKPENAKNFFFATCKDIEQQCTLVKNFDNKPVADGNLSVKVAIDKTKKVSPKRIPTY